MGICLGTAGKAWNSSLLPKGAADWSAAGAHLDGFAFAKVEEGLWKLTPLRGLNVGGVAISRLASKSQFKNFLWIILAILWKPHYVVCFGEIGCVVRVTPWSLVHPKIGGKLAPGAPMCPSCSKKCTTCARGYENDTLGGARRAQLVVKGRESCFKVVPKVASKVHTRAKSKVPKRAQNKHNKKK